MKNIFLFIYEGMADFEISLLTNLLRSEGGFNIITIAYEMKALLSSSGMRIMPHMTVEEALRVDTNGLIIPGGRYNELRSELKELISKMNRDEKLLAAICFAPWMLAVTGIFEDKKYTTSIEEWTSEHIDFFEMSDPFPRANYMPSRMVRDGHVFTAKGHAFIDFAIEICDYFKLFKSDEEKVEFEISLKR